MVSNTFLNKVLGKVVPIFGDSCDLTSRLFKSSIDRILMPLPEKAIHFLDIAIEAIKPKGGIIHYQGFVHADKGENPLDIANEVVESRTNIVRVENSRVIREVGSFRYQIALDLKIGSK